MLTGGPDLLYRALLATNYAPIHRVEVWRAGVRIDTYGDVGLPITSGNIGANLTSQVTRTLSLTMDGELFPADDTGLMAPFGNELRVFAGTSGVGGPDYLWPVFRGLIASVSKQEDTATVNASDRAGEVADNLFRAPQASAVGARILAEFKRLIREGVPRAEFGLSDALWESVPELIWETSRSSALDDLAKAANAFWYALADGSFVMRRVPWSLTTATPVVALLDGDGGVITSAQITWSRQELVNTWMVVGERADGTVPVYATAIDDNPASPTYVKGPFGVRGKVLQAQAAQTFGQAYALAQANLRRSRASAETWNVEMVADASLELGDVAVLNSLGRTATKVLSSFNFPLGGSTTMSTVWRSLGDLSTVEEL